MAGGEGTQGFWWVYWKMLVVLPRDNGSSIQGCWQWEIGMLIGVLEDADGVLGCC